MSSKLELPNPGGKRYWDIRTDDDGDYTITLCGEFGAEICLARIYRSDASHGEFIYQAEQLIKQNAARVQYTGTYKFEEN